MGASGRNARGVSILMGGTDRWGVAFAGCLILGLVAAGIAASVTRLPNGGYDIGGYWTTAMVGVGVWLGSSALLLGLLLARRRRG